MSVLQESLHKILASRSPTIGDLFYPRLFAACPEAVAFFDDTEMQVQSHILTNGLQVVVAIGSYGYPAAESYLKIIGHRHFHRKIPADMYAPWGDCMLATLEEFHGAEWNGELAKQWQNAIQIATQAMLKGYTPDPMHY
jgi:hemoglobin-like flavoprotein